MGLSREQANKIAGRDLTMQNSDRLDFFEVSKSQLENMLQKAYQVGFDKGYNYRADEESE